MNEPGKTAAYNLGQISEATDAIVATPQHIGRYRVKEILGRGGFGLVYLAHDEQLQRPVAIKVPYPRRVFTPADAEPYLTEARIVANLDHPNIVPIFDVGSSEDWPCFIVSKFIEGTDLATRIKQSKLTIHESVELVATVAEALHHAHKQGRVHRDIKPGNILLDKDGKPFVADFGLALREQELGKGPRYVGTPAYMSPEQARGEGHRVDGRSDIFSLGVVFYELLTGRRPFTGETQNELLEQIIGLEARPPRQADDVIPKELDRICLKALAKRVSERYSASKDFADDLRSFLAQQPNSTANVVSPSITPVAKSPSTMEGPVPFVTPITPLFDSQPVKIVPKGLRSFDAHDADFFLELMPGPRDRDGLPDSIRHWKTRIEETDPDNTFSVGLIYGPSGCGKSSMVKAGLLPKLGKSVTAVYVEATGEETEARLLKALRRQVASLPPNLELVDSLIALRQGRFLETGRKVLVVLDQFEQWLHAKRNEVNTELVQALRQCDGGRLQCVIMVRDDFWLAVSRFLNDLEVDLVHGRNVSLVDLFDLRHARKVAIAFGRAFGALPEAGQRLNKEQDAFLDQAVAGLAQDGKVISVRLALFAEMVKGKAWTAATLKAVGGAEGVGVSFLDETFTTAASNPKHRLNQKAAEAVLKALLPEAGTDIMGNMRSYAELLHASGYESRPKDFDDLIRILDSDLRLITPTDPEGKDEAGTMKDKPAKTADSSVILPPSSSPKYYQLTHDYLVPSLRKWLTRKQMETSRGRAELLLADRAAEWNVRPENRQLPSLRQWLGIRWRTAKKYWTPPQRKMMRKADKHHLVRGGALAVLLLIVTIAGLAIRHQVIDRRNAIHAAGLINRLLDADIAQVPGIVLEIDGFRSWTDPQLREKFDQAANDSPQKLRTGLALLPVDPELKEYLSKRLLNADPREVPVIREALAPYREALRDKLWSVVEQTDKGVQSPRLRAASALAKYDPESENWASNSAAIANDLASVPAAYLALWMDMLRPVREQMINPLSDIYRNLDRREMERSLASEILADYAADRPNVLADLVMDADEKQFSVLFPKLDEHRKQGVVFLKRELDGAPFPEWADPPLDPSWKECPTKIRQKIEAAHGILADRFAFTETMPLEEFLNVAEALRKSGFRPIRFRPFKSEKSIEVAAIWTRDGIDWRMVHGLTKEKLIAHDKELQSKNFIPEDVAGYEDNGLVFGAVWVVGNPAAAGRRLSLGIPQSLHQAEFDRINEFGLKPITVQATTLAGNQTVFNQIFGAVVVKEGDLEQRTVLERETFIAFVHAGLCVDASISEWTPDAPMKYAGVRYVSTTHSSIELCGILDEKYSATCQSLAAMGYRPKAIGMRSNDWHPKKMAAMVWHRPNLILDEAKEKFARRQANAAVALLKMAQPEKVWPVLMHSHDPRARSYLIHRFNQLGADATAIVDHFDHEPDVTIRRALLLSLGEFDEGKLSPAARQPFLPRLKEIYRLDADAGLHGASEWLLRKWDQESWLRQNDEEAAHNQQQRQNDIRQLLAKHKEETPPQWYTNSARQTMVVIPGPVSFQIQATSTEVGRNEVNDKQEPIRIGRSFAIGAKAVTVAEFQQFRANHTAYFSQPNCPMNRVTWYDAAAYCNWLSEQERLEAVYEPNNDNEYGPGMRLKPNYLQLSGYRLPTAAEWVYACRAGAVTSRYYGETAVLLGKYAWYSPNTFARSTQPVGVLKPNDLGLFDMLGNVIQWCGNRDDHHPGRDDEEDANDVMTVDNNTRRMSRGGSYTNPEPILRSDLSLSNAPLARASNYGFRVARTIPP